MSGSLPVVDTSALEDQSHDSTIKIITNIVCKIVYRTLGLLFIGFGCLALIDGTQWWGLIFILNGILFLNSFFPLNEKGRKTAYRKLVYLFLGLFFGFLGILIVVPPDSFLKQWFGIFCLIIMTEFFILSVSMKNISQTNSIKNLLGSLIQIKTEVKRMAVVEGNKKLSLFEILVGVVSIITGIIAIYSFLKGK